MANTSFALTCYGEHGAMANTRFAAARVMANTLWQKVTSRMIIAVRGEGVTVIYSARPQAGRKMECDTKRLWPGRAWGGTGKIFPANCLLSFTPHFSEGTATCGNICLQGKKKINHQASIINCHRFIRSLFSFTDTNQWLFSSKCTFFWTFVYYITYVTIN